MKNLLTVLFLTIWLAALVVWSAERFALKIETFEDGSGSVTWCLPWAPCRD